jgi:branched-chain amino acid transport system permease protein
MSWPYLLQQALNASTLSALYGLLAVSYVLVHAITKRVNFAFGALSVWAGYILITQALGLMNAAPGQTLLPLLCAGLIAVVSTVVVGAAMERAVVRPLVRQSTLAMLIATLGLSIVLEELMRVQNSSSEGWLMPVFQDPIALVPAGDSAIETNPLQIAVVAIALLLAGGLILGMRRLPFGRAWRAVAQDITMAELAGIDAGRTLALTFAVASAYAGTAGALSAVYYGQASFYSGLILGLKTLLVAVAGGLNSLSGAFAAALLLGVFETLWSAYANAEIRDIVSLAGLSALMILSPIGALSEVNRIEPR